MLLYLLGLFIGAIGTGSITPVRTIIQNSLGVDDRLGIWMITIYTLFYAAIIPISGKLADRHGRKIVFLISIFLFGAGSVVCGLSAGMESFAVLLAGRVISAVGAGGIMPIATAEFGTSFPEEKRGMALGMVGGVYGIGNVLGATVGSAILDIFGTGEWEWIFYLNVPFCLFIIIGGFLCIPNHRSEEVYRIDKLGTLLLTVIILAFLYGLKNLDFFDFASSLMSRDVWLYLLIAAALMPVFVIVEKRAEDPVFHIEYMRNSQIVLTLAMGLLVGCSMMGMIFIPQFAENCLKIPSGDGGYFVIILGFFAGVVSPVSGKLIDKFGSKPIMAAGFAVSVLGAAYLAFVATECVNTINVLVSLTLIGLGMGLTLGTPLNYMMMRHTKEEESNSALATLSLLRSIGTAIAPAIMVGFIAQAGAGMQDDLMKEMPEIPDVPQMEQQVELDEIIDELSTSEEFADKMGDIDLKEMSNRDMSMDIDMGASGGELELPDELLDELRTSDVTTITKACKDMAAYMFDTFTPDVIADIRDGIGEGIDGISKGIEGVDSGISEMQTAVSEIDSGRAGISRGISGISKGIMGMSAGLAQIKGEITEMNGEISDMNDDIAGMTEAVAGVEQAVSGIESTPGWEDIPGMKEQHDELVQKQDEMNSALEGMEQGLAGMQSGKSSLTAKLAKAKKERQEMRDAYNEMGEAKAQLLSAIEDVEQQRELMVRAKSLMQSMSDDIPGVFSDVEDEYMSAIDDKKADIETVIRTRSTKGSGICLSVLPYSI